MEAIMVQLCNGNYVTVKKECGLSVWTDMNSVPSISPFVLRKERIKKYIICICL